MAAKRTVLRQVVELPVTANCCWEKEMGGDEFCKTYRVRYNKTHEMGIIKSINIGLVSKASQKDIDSVWKQFLADLAILRGLADSPYVGKPGSLSTTYDREVLHVQIPMQPKNLCSFVNSEERQVLEATQFGRFDFLMRKYIYQIAKGLQHLHDNRICHQRICLENILVVNDDEDIVLSDAYFKRSFKFGYLSDSLCWPPEMFHPNGKHNFSTDMYMVGVLLLELLVGERVKARTRGPLSLQPKLLEKYNQKMHLQSPKQFKEIVDHLIAEKPDQRWSAKQLADHLEERVLAEQGKYRGGLSAIKKKTANMADEGKGE